MSLAKIAAVGSAISPWVGAIGTAGSILGGFLDRKQQKSQIQQNLAMQRENNQFMYNFAKNRDKWNADMQREQWERETEYNSPKNQFARLQEAGVNPWSAFSDNSGTVGNTSMAPPVSNGIPNFQAPKQEIISGSSERTFGLFNSLAAALANLGQAKKSGVETKALEKKLPLELENYELSNDIMKFRNNLEKKFGEEKQSAELKKMINDVDEGLERIVLLQKQQKNEEADTILKQWEQKFNMKRWKWFDKTLQQEFLNLVQQGKTLAAQANAANATAENQRASASLTREQRSILNDSHEYLVKLNELNSKQKGIDYFVARQTIWDKVNLLHNQKLITDSQYDQMQEQLERLRKENDWYEFNQTVNAFSQIISSASGLSSPLPTSTTTSNYDGNGNLLFRQERTSQ